MERIASRESHDIAALRERVKKWRRIRTGPGPMPSELWAEAEAIARRRGLYATARGVGIDYGTLAKRLKSTPVQQNGQGAIAFVEWRGAEILAQAPGASGMVEVTDVSGRRMTVRLDDSSSIDVASLVAAFCQARS